MNPLPQPARPERFKLGGPQRVLVAVDPPSLMLRMTEVVRSIEGLEPGGSFANGMDAIEWLLWERKSWHFAFVDLDLQGSQDLVQRLQAQPRPGTVVALVPHVWEEVRADCARRGIHRMLEKGDIIAFRGFLEQEAR